MSHDRPAEMWSSCLNLFFDWVTCLLCKKPPFNSSNFAWFFGKILTEQKMTFEICLNHFEMCKNYEMNHSNIKRLFWVRFLLKIGFLVPMHIFELRNQNHESCQILFTFNDIIGTQCHFVYPFKKRCIFFGVFWRHVTPYWYLGVQILVKRRRHRSSLFNNKERFSPKLKPALKRLHLLIVCTPGQSNL